MSKKKPAKKPMKKAAPKAAPKRTPTAPKKAPSKTRAKASPKPAKKPTKAVLAPTPRRTLPKPVQPTWLPAGYRTLTPRLVVKDTAAAIAWYTKALGAEEVTRFVYGGMCMHAELKIGDSRIHLNDQVPGAANVAPGENHAPTSGMDVYVADCDELFGRAVENGATALMPVMDSFWGDRCGVVRDPFGHVWMISTHVKDMTKEEIDAAAQVAFASMPCTEAGAPSEAKA